MKRGLFIWVFLLVFAIGFVSFVSGAACTDEETILRLYQDTNSHGAEFDQTAYPVQVCTPNGETVVRDSCNKYFYLSDEINAHAKVAYQDETYDVGVCYKMDPKRQCELVIGDCPSERPIELLKFSDSINAHLSLPGDENYDYRLCCIDAENPLTINECSTTAENIWYDENGEDQITTTEEGYCDNEDTNSRIDISERSNWKYQWTDACCSGSLACVGDDSEGDDSLCRSVAGLNTINDCPDYKGEATCNADDNHVADARAPASASCEGFGTYNLVGAECKWSEVSGCYQELDYGDYSCRVTQDPQQCRGGFMSVLVESIFYGTEGSELLSCEDSLCEDSKYLSVCGGETLKLFGFTWVNAILVLIILAAFYLAFLKRQKRKGEKVLKIGKRDSGKKKKGFYSILLMASNNANF
jgi:hypothetical protein